MKVKILGLVGSVLALFMVACGSGRPEPADVVESCWRLLAEGSVSEAVELLDVPSSARPVYEELYLSRVESLQAAGGVSSVEVLLADERDGEATVEMRIVFGSGDESTATYHLVLRDKRWLIRQ